MMKLTSKQMVVALAAVLVAGAALFIGIPSSQAAINIPPPGTINPCAGFKTHPLAFVNGPVFESTTDGGIIVEVGSHFRTADGRNGAELIIRDLRSSGQVDGLGFVEIGFDATRSGRSSIVANQKEADYPATQTMRFSPTVTVDGKAFRAIDGANLVNTAVTSTPPEIGTVYVLTNDVRLESVDKPGTVAMVIKASKAFTVTGHDFK